MGDSRAVISMNDGKIVKSISVDHKPAEDGEKKRITENGGQVYKYF